MQAKDTLSRVRAEDYEEATVERKGWLSPGLGFPRTKPDCCCAVSVISVARCGRIL